MDREELVDENLIDNGKPRKIIRLYDLSGESPEPTLLNKQFPVRNLGDINEALFKSGVDRVETTFGMYKKVADFAYAARCTIDGSEPRIDFVPVRRLEYDLVT